MKTNWKFKAYQEPFDSIPLIFLFAFQRIPTDDRYVLWEQAISSNADPPFKGFICYQHFSDDDFTSQKKNCLRKNVLPKLFDRKESDQNDEGYENIGEIGEIEPNIQVNLQDLQQENESIEANLQYKQLYEQYAEEKSKWNVHEQKLNRRIKNLESDCAEQRKHIKRLHLKLQREEKSKRSLNKLLEDLHANKLLDSENFTALQASIQINSIDETKIMIDNEICKTSSLDDGFFLTNVNVHFEKSYDFVYYFLCYSV